jgi:hypothetical protein
MHNAQCHHPGSTQRQMADTVTLYTGLLEKQTQFIRLQFAFPNATRKCTITFSKRAIRLGKTPSIYDTCIWRRYATVQPSRQQEEENSRRNKSAHSITFTVCITSTVLLILFFISSRFRLQWIFISLFHNWAAVSADRKPWPWLWPCKRMPHLFQDRDVLPLGSSNHMRPLLDHPYLFMYWQVSSKNIRPIKKGSFPLSKTKVSKWKVFFLLYKFTFFLLLINFM